MGLALAVAGIKGRMGRQIASLSLSDHGFDLVGGTVEANDPDAGKMHTLTDMSGGTHELPAKTGITAFQTTPAVVIDFTAPEATLSLLQPCIDAGIAMVIGTTGFADDQEKQIADAAKQMAIVKAGNMSLGVNLLTLLVEKAAAALSDDFDIEIHEAHHKHKKDAPSGTALMLGEAAAKGRNIDLHSNAIHARQGQTGERPSGKIGFSVTRAGGIIGEHEVLFGSDEEVISLSHAALDRAVFARGALTAAKWVSGQKPGLYSMRDVLGL